MRFLGTDNSQTGNTSIEFISARRLQARPEYAGRNDSAVANCNRPGRRSKVDATDPRRSSVDDATIGFNSRRHHVTS
jgi:hypothetical protein